MVATRFAVATHILLLLANCGEAAARGPTTSGRLAVSVNTNPVVVRRITGQLARAGLIRVHRGLGGAELAMPASQISLSDVWQAVHAGTARPLLPLHPRPNGTCPEARRVRQVLGDAFGDAEDAFCRTLADVTLDSLVARCAARARLTGIGRRADHGRRRTFSWSAAGRSHEPASRRHC